MANLFLKSQEDKTYSTIKKQMDIIFTKPQDRSFLHRVIEGHVLQNPFNG